VKAWPTLTKIAVLAVFIGVALFGMDLRAFAGHLRANLLWAAVAVQPLIAVTVAISALRLALLAGTPKVPFRVALRCVVLSLGMNQILPGRISEVLKATYLRDHAGVALSAGVSAIVVERLFDTMMLGILLLLAVGVSVAEPNKSLIVVVITVSAGFAALPWLRPFLLRIVRHVPWPRLRDFVQAIVDRISGVLRPAVLFPVALLTAALWLVSAGKYAFFLSLTGSVPIGMAGAFVVYIAATIGGAVPALPGGFGTYEAAIVFALRIQGYSIEEGLSIAIGMHLGFLWVIVLLSIVIAMRERLGIRSLVAQGVAAIRDRPQR
jgi:uncharacterized membrane protein YbhN (UPF0104 family)